MNTAENLLKTLENHPLTKQILAEKAAETIERRKEAVSKIDELRIELENTPAPETGTADLRAELAELEGKARELRKEIDMKAVQIRGTRLELEGAINRAKYELLESYDERLDAAIEHFRALHEKIRQTKPTRQGYKGERNLIAETETFVTATNVSAIRAALDYCRESISELEGMKLSAQFDHERVEALKAGVPSIEGFEEITGTRTMPGLKGVNPLWAFPGDSEYEWSMKKLEEKFKKLMKH
jgi:chromosome segregation ATPase